MKLSEAMILGSTLSTPKNSSWNTCLLGLSCHALGKENFFNIEAFKRWPWIQQTERWGGMELPVTTLLTSMCQDVINGKMTIEQVAEWVRSVEPAEESEQTGTISVEPQVEVAL